MKVSLWMIIALMVSVFIMDLTCTWVIREKIANSLEISLDIALSCGIIESDMEKGMNFIDETKGYKLAIDCLKKNMGLNNSLENAFLKNTTLNLKFQQDGIKPKATMEFKTTFIIMITQIIGLKGVPICIKKTHHYMGNYK